MLENQLGKIIAYERNKSGISVNELCSGLCSTTFLFRIETGERTCEKILADALLQRMGISGEKFVYIASTDEQEWVFLREQLINVVDSGNMAEAERIMIEYKELTRSRSKLHSQFLLLAEAVLKWKNGINNKNIQDILKEAFEITRPNVKWHEIEAKRLSFNELILSIMHGRIAEEQHDLLEAEKMYYLSISNMASFMAPQDRVKLYPQVAYRLVMLLIKRGNLKEAYEHVYNSIYLLKQYGNINYMQQFLELHNTILIELCGENISPKQRAGIEENKRICTSLNWLYAQYHLPEMQWLWNIPYSMGEVELCQEVIKKRRKVLGLSQEQLAENICDPVSMSRIETGKVKPKIDNLKKLMARVGMAGESYVTWHQVNDPELLELTRQITEGLALGRLDNIDELLKILEKKVSLDNFNIQQYLEYIKALVNLNLGKIDKKEHWEQQERALYLTLPKVPIDKLQDWVFSSQEVEIINSLSYSCETVNKQNEIIALLQMIMHTYQEKNFSLDYYIAGIELTTRNLGNLLGNVGRYKEAIEVADYGIYWALKRGNCSVLKTLLYDRGWDMEQLGYENDFSLAESLKYMNAALALSTLLGNRKMISFICRHIEKVYNTN